MACLDFRVLAVATGFVAGASKIAHMGENMPMGPGKYDAECMRDLVETQADGVLLIVLGGKKGSGFSLAAFSADILAMVPAILRDTAGEIEASSEKA
jgi:hypothetical protein